jgi:prolyl-tRNA editing enzyme YbaK/EbsC (Cys-tRNA(Pro) deacylase)
LQDNDVLCDSDLSRQRLPKPTAACLPPFGHSTQLRVFVDPDLLQYDEVWAAAGTWNDNFGAAPTDIVRVAGGVVTDLKRM